jgi:hypothetical protein
MPTNALENKGLTASRIGRTLNRLQEPEADDLESERNSDPEKKM